MARLTVNAINRAIAAKGLKAELVRGRGYFYFLGDDVDLCNGTSVMVYRLGQLSLEQWLGELDNLISKGTKS